MRIRRQMRTSSRRGLKATTRSPTKAKAHRDEDKPEPHEDADESQHERSDRESVRAPRRGHVLTGRNSQRDRSEARAGAQALA